MNQILQDFHYGARMFLKNPGFTLVAVLTLALGIGVTTAVFSWLEAVVLRPLPGVGQPAELVSFESTNDEGWFTPTSYADYRDYRKHLKQLAGLAAAMPSAFSLGADDHAERIWGEVVSGNYFSVLQVQPIAGRVFTESEYGDKQGAYPVVVLGEDLWTRSFHRDRKIIGRTIRVNRRPLTVVGVVPKAFHGSVSGLSLGIWTPLMMAPALGVMPDSMLADRGSRLLYCVGRLRTGATLPMAEAEATAFGQQVAKENPMSNTATGVAVLPLAKEHFGAQTILGEPLLILMAVCGLLLLIVCGNVANLLLARATARSKEFGVRLALGARRWRIVRQLLTENLILAVLAGLSGAFLASWLSEAMFSLVPQSGLPVSMDLQMNSDVLLFTMALCLGATLLAGIAPAFQSASSADLNEILRQGGRTGSSGRQSNRLRSFL